MSGSASELLVEDIGGVRLITLNRPETLNALNDALMRALAQAAASAAVDPDIGCVVITGAGRGFCSGGDLKGGGTRSAPTDRRIGGRTEQSFTRLRAHIEASRLLHEMPKPTIAMINGPVAGAGIGIAGACDLRFAAQSATFKSAFDRIGASGDFGSTWFWTKILGSGAAREMFLLGETYQADAALARGLYTRVLPDDELRAATLAAARRIADGPRMGYRYMKANLNLAEDAQFEAALDHEAMNMCLSTTASLRIHRAEQEAARQDD